MSGTSTIYFLTWAFDAAGRKKFSEDFFLDFAMAPLKTCLPLESGLVRHFKCVQAHEFALTCVLPAVFGSYLLCLQHIIIRQQIGRLRQHLNSGKLRDCLVR